MSKVWVTSRSEIDLALRVDEKKKGSANMCKGSIASKILYIAKRSATIRQRDTKTQLYP